MRYEKDAASSGRTNVGIALFVLAILLVAQTFMTKRPDVSTFDLVLLWGIGGAVILMFGGLGISLLRSGGKWQINIDKNGVRWETPNDNVDKSFNLELSVISRTETRVKRNRKGRSTRKYFLITTSGNEIRLSPNSGINLVSVITELERLEIKNVTVDKRNK